MKYLIWVVLYLCTVVASSASFVFPLGDANVWYTSLVSPSFSPPNWLFGPVWTILYLLIATSAWKLLHSSLHKYTALAISLWALQMGLNTIWTPVFSGAENLEAALYYIVALWLSIVSYVVVAWKVNRTASLMFIPYLAWVSFASLLNYNYWLLN
jgi:tryptophan-rich sensory protein